MLDSIKPFEPDNPWYNFVKYLERLSPHDRLEVIGDLPFCRFCGYDDPDHNCQCWNDD